tara:strand:+ start:755 stop:1189 length:435 start_codon:yes stop_codon:yes gene_type:complete
MQIKDIQIKGMLLTNVQRLIKVILLVLLSIGLYGALSVSYLTVTGIAPCPSVANIPACFIVTIGYFLMLIATLFNNIHNAKWVFIVGWAPVVLLALVGSLLELNQGDICPKSSMGIALCYVSLSFASMVATLFWLLNKMSRFKK